MPAVQLSENSALRLSVTDDPPRSTGSGSDSHPTRRSWRSLPRHIIPQRPEGRRLLDIIRRLSDSPERGRDWERAIAELRKLAADQPCLGSYRANSRRSTSRQVAPAGG